MRASNSSSKSGEKRCVLCQRSFTPHPKVKERQRVCSRRECQRLRQKLNHLFWLAHNPVDYRQWYRDYGKAWRRQHPAYQKRYREKKSLKGNGSQRAPVFSKQQLLKAFIWLCKGEKKEELTSITTAGKRESSAEKKEQLAIYYYLIKGSNVELFPLKTEKKEQLASCFN